MSASVDSVARRVVTLLDHPRAAALGPEAVRLAVPDAWDFSCGFARRWATGWSSRCNGKIGTHANPVSSRQMTTH